MSELLDLVLGLEAGAYSFRMVIGTVGAMMRKMAVNAHFQGIASAKQLVRTAIAFGTIWLSSGGILVYNL